MSSSTPPVPVGLAQLSLPQGDLCGCLVKNGRALTLPLFSLLSTFCYLTYYKCKVFLLNLISTFSPKYNLMEVYLFWHFQHLDESHTY